MVQPKLNKIHISFFVAFFLHFLHYFLRANVLPPSQFSVLGGMVPRIARIHFQLTWIELAPFHTEFRLSRVDLCVPQSPPPQGQVHFHTAFQFVSFPTPPPRRRRGVHEAAAVAGRPAGGAVRLLPRDDRPRGVRPHGLPGLLRRHGGRCGGRRRGLLPVTPPLPIGAS